MAETSESAESPVISCLNLFDSFVAVGHLNGDIFGCDLRAQKKVGFDVPPFLDKFASEIVELNYGEITAEEIETRYVNTCTSFVLRGGCKQWPAANKWDLDYFKINHGDVKVNVTMHGGKKEESTLREYIESWSRFKSSTNELLPYLRGWYFERDCPSLLHDVEIPSWARDMFEKLPKKNQPEFHWIYLGASGTKTPLHVDPLLTHAWLAQIHGRKKFTMFSPRDIPLLLGKGGFVDYFNPDREKFPKFDESSPMEVVLNPGDIIFVPRFWPHAVEAIDDSISVTFNFLQMDVYSNVRNAFLIHKLGKIQE